jgi:DNA-binding transcriptional LysR family regulator
MNSEFVSLPLRGGKAVNVHPTLVADDPTVVTRFARDGDCIAYVPDLPSLRDRTLERVLEDDLVAVAREHLVVPAVLADVPRVREFSILCQSKFEAFQPFR